MCSGPISVDLVFLLRHLQFSVRAVLHHHQCACVVLPELCEALGSYVLTGVLNASQQVGNKLVDGAFVLHRSRNTLSNFNLIALTVRGNGVSDTMGLVNRELTKSTLKLYRVCALNVA